MIIAVDFDDTITEPSKYPVMGKIKPKAIEVLKKLKKEHTLVLWTCRTGDYLREAVESLEAMGMVFDYINDYPFIDTGRKIYADIYIDDRAFGGIVDWEIIEKNLLMTD